MSRGAWGAREPREPLETPGWMLTARPLVALVVLAALGASALLPGNDTVYVAVVAVLVACGLFAVHLGNLQRPDYTKRNALIMLGLLGAFASVGVGRLAWAVLGG